MQEKWHWKLDEFGIWLSQDVPKTQQEQTKRRQDKAPNSPSAVSLHQSSQMVRCTWHADHAQGHIA